MRLKRALANFPFFIQMQIDIYAIFEMKGKCKTVFNIGRLVTQLIVRGCFVSSARSSVYGYDASSNLLFEILLSTMPQYSTTVLKGRQEGNFLHFSLTRFISFIRFTSSLRSIFSPDSQVLLGLLVLLGSIDLQVTLVSLFLHVGAYLRLLGVLVDLNHQVGCK